MIKHQIVYTGKKEGYRKWADNLWSQGLNTTITEVANLLHTSEKWVNLNILEDIPHVIYTKNFIHDKKAGTQTKRISMDDVINWIIEFGKFEVQTEVVDFYSYLSNADKKKADKVYKEYKDAFKRVGDYYNKGTIPESVFSLIRKEFHLSKDVMTNMKVTHRSEYKWVEVEPFNIFDHEYYFANEEGSAELFYRQAFLAGDIKVTLGKGRVIFVKANQKIDNMKMPFVVKKNTKIIIK